MRLTVWAVAVAAGGFVASVTSLMAGPWVAFGAGLLTAWGTYAFLMDDVARRA